MIQKEQKNKHACSKLIRSKKQTKADKQANLDNHTHELTTTTQADKYKY